MKDNCEDFGFPKGTVEAVRWTTIIRQEQQLPLSERISSRMVKIAANLPKGEWIGWQMAIPTDSSVRFSSFGSKSVKQSDLEWVVEEAADTEWIAKENTLAQPDDIYASWNLYEIELPIAEAKEIAQMGFAADPHGGEGNVFHDFHLNYYRWPQNFSDQFGELLAALRVEGACLRFMVGSADIDEQKACIRQVENTWSPCGIEISSYVGYPVRTRLLLAMPGEPGARIRAIISVCVPGAELCCIGTLKDKTGKAAWNTPLAEARVLPDLAARIMAFEPAAGTKPIIGVQARDPEAKLLPSRHKDSKRGCPIKIGKAMDISGMERVITVSDEDLRRHWQIIGQTGTGKSTLLASVIRECVETGHGLTFFDPHGSTVDFVLHILPKEYADRIRVVRIGDIDNPVPLNMWETDDPKKAERTISDMCLLFQEIFDPNHEGFVGPRWERMFSLLAQASIAVFGKKASFETIIALSRGKLNVKHAANIVKDKYSGLADSLTAEWVNNTSNDFVDGVAWFISKFQRLTSVEQLRNTLGAGANALDFGASIDTDTVTLIDLALPTIGTHAARVIGTLLLQQLWAGALKRKNRSDTHIVVIDETHLFQTNPLPQMLAEGRKFGAALILAHQHIGQLTHDVREALGANSANFSAFCLSIKDAYDVRDRFDDPAIQRDLSRQNTFCAMTTLSVDGNKSPAFTLKIERPDEQPDGVAIAASIEAESIRALVDPYREDKPISDDEIVSILIDESSAADTRREEEAEQTKAATLRQWVEEVQASSPQTAGTDDPRDYNDPNDDEDYVEPDVR